MPRSKRRKTDGATGAATARTINGGANERSDSHGKLSTLANAKGKERGKLFNFFQELPADVMGEIVSYLWPADLLHLACVAKGPRQFLMSSSSAMFWRRANKNNMRLPDCPEDLSEPAYAHLLFSDFCHKCLAEDRDVLLHIEARAQLCEPCTLEEFKRWKELPVEIDAALSEFVPATTHRLTDAEKRQDPVKASATFRYIARTRFHVKTALRLHEEYKNLTSVEEKETWLIDQREAWACLELHAEQCERYIHVQGPKGHDNMWAAKVNRSEQIGRRLADLGWGDEFRTRVMDGSDTPSANEMDTLIFQKCPLTDEEWDTIKVGLVQWMQEIREARQRLHDLNRMRERVETALGNAYRTYVLAQPSGALVPTLAELALMDAFAQPLESSPLDKDMPNGTLDSALALLPELVEEWRTQLEEKILDLLRQSPAYANQRDLTKTVLYHASTLFTCSRCRGVLTYPTLFAHECFLKTLSSTNKRAIAPDARMKKTTNVSLYRSQATWETECVGALIHAAFSKAPCTFGAGPSIWHPGPLLQFNNAMHFHTVSILDSLGLDRSTSAATLLATNLFVEGVCKCFHPGVPNRAPALRTATRWLQAISQCRRHRSGNYANSFSPVDEAQLQGLALHATAIPIRATCLCPWCGVSQSSFAMEWHLTIKHSISQADAERVHEIVPVEVKHRHSTIRIGT